MSVSQYKDFLKCEASALARLNRKNVEPKSEALLFGSYVHSWLDGTIEEFKTENPDLFSTRGASKGELKAQYKLADEMIKVLENDPFCMMALQGEKEVIMTGELFGIQWKMRMDVYNPSLGRFSDLKTVKALNEKYWKEGVGYCSFVEAYGYITQLAVYSEIERRNRGGDSWLESYLVAVSKQDPPDKAIITIDQDTLAMALGEVEEKITRVAAVKAGEVKPIECGKCYHCRRNKKITTVIHYMDLIS
ncbi:hypothetical protein CGZ90_00615 [Fictibacillus aquaticus]|uniref:Putative exodeoxyribonuclease 8 PDDEXK-like domain-containing protein n=2 Tax=Fictibacillus aquaticus TaxID=2021314 RepID=A0A235FEK1_9BACL|nr:hypothetical protein CGZ90_00615 [Fictibacillus aquaticus]